VRTFTTRFTYISDYDELKDITHVSQNTPSSCAHACIAMLTDLPLNTVQQDLKSILYLENELKPLAIIQALTMYNVHALPVMTTSAIYKNGLYILSVPSLNSRIAGTTHAVILDASTEKIYDPQKGNHEKRFYRELSEIPGIHSALSVRSLFCDELGNERRKIRKGILQTALDDRGIEDCTEEGN
jgi:hypothetical protein